jgi:hypothetical protein
LAAALLALFRNQRPIAQMSVRPYLRSLVKDALSGAARRGESVPPSSLSKLRRQVDWPAWI